MAEDRTDLVLTVNPMADHERDERVIAQHRSRDNTGKGPHDSSDSPANSHCRRGKFGNSPVDLNHGREVRVKRPRSNS